MSIVRVNLALGSLIGSSARSSPQAHYPGNFLVLAVGGEPDTASLSTVTDLAGNTWTKLTKSIQAGAVAIQIAYAFNIGGHPSNVVTCTFTGSPTALTSIVVQYSGVQTSADPFDVQASGNGNGTAAVSGSATPAAVDELLINAAVNFGGVTFSPTSPWVTEVSENGTIALDERIVTPASGSYTAAQTASGVTDWAIALATFKAAAAVAATSNVLPRRMAASIWQG